MRIIDKAKPENIDAYLAILPPSIRSSLSKLRIAIKQAAPEAEEMISYGMPAFKYKGMLVYFAAHAEHIGFYPGSKLVITVFKKELIDYKTSAGTIQFPLGKVLPLGLIKKIVKFRVKQNEEKQARKLKESKV
jgi:uncharacterized protein YdhG (YjbR/CyaY superfamily)